MKDSVDQRLVEAGRGAIAIRNELDRVRAERDSWKAQFHSAAAAASEYSEFWEKHHGDFDQFGNYIPYSQMDGDLRAAKAEIERLRAALKANLQRDDSVKRPHEVAAKAAYEKFNENLIPSLEPEWDRLPQDFKERMMDAQRAAIEAYEAAPQPAPD